MTPFKECSITPESLWKTIEALIEQGVPREVAAKSVEASAMNVDHYMNDTYHVAVRALPGAAPDGGDLIHLSIKRHDREPIHDWRHLQQIKNELVDPECEAIELYPAESRRVDSANQYHLWVVLDKTYRFPIGWKERLVTDGTLGGSKNRPLNSKGM
jgi:hypothetical protein